MANNNNKNASFTQDISEPVSSSQLGTLLAAERNKRGLGERETADALKISVSRLKSIEANDFTIFPSETYVRGHLRNYCRFLKLDEQRILSLYDDSKPKDESDELLMNDEQVAVNNGEKRWWFVYLVLVLFVLLWAVSYWLLGAKEGETASSSFPESISRLPSSELSGNIGNSASGSSSVESSALAVQTPDASTNTSTALSTDTAIESSVANVSNEGNQVESEALPVVTDGFSPSDLSTGGAGEESEQDKTIIVSKLTAAELVKTIQSQEEPVEQDKPVPEGDTLQFGFQNASWIQVVDSTGAVLFKGLNKPGAELDLNGKAPFSIVIGNVDGTSLVYNGESVELAAPRGKNTLRLTLGG